MKKNAVNWFEVPVKNLKRAKEFYSNLLDVELQDMQMPGSEMSAFPMIQGGEYSTGALIKAEGYEPSTKGSVVYFSCEDVSIQLDKVEKIGGKIMVPKTSIGEHGFIAHIGDTEGNRVALHSVK